MADSETPQQGPNSQGISLDELSEVYARAVGEGRPSAPTMKTAPNPAGVDQTFGQGDEADNEGFVAENDENASFQPKGATDPVAISPLTVLEAMLFVGSLDNQPLEPARAAELMRGVSPSDVCSLIEQLNTKYRANGCPYKVISEGAGYRMTLRRAFEAVRRKLYGRIREARLSQAAIDTLAIVAYRQPLTGDQVSQLRGTPSGHLLNQLVRRQLLKVDKSAGQKKMLYRTSTRFLELFGLESLEELPDSQ